MPHNICESEVYPFYLCNTVRDPPGFLLVGINLYLVGSKEEPEI